MVSGVTRGVVTSRKFPRRGGGRVTVTPGGDVIFGGGSSPAEAHIAKVQETLVNQEAEQLKQQALEREMIQKEQFESNRLARERFEQSQREAVTKEQREQAQQTFFQERNLAQLEASEKRQQSGISRPAPTPKQFREQEGVIITRPSKSRERFEAEREVKGFVSESIRRGGTLSIDRGDIISTRTVELESPSIEKVEGEPIGGKAIDFLFGEGGKKFIGIGGSPGSKPLFTVQQIRGSLEKRGLAGRVGSQILKPIETPGGVAIVASTPAVFGLLPRVIQLGAGVTFTALETKAALNVNLPKEQRIASGIFATAIGTGTLLSVVGTRVKLKTNTQFKSTISQGDKFSKVDVFAVTKAGEESVFTVSREKILNLEDSFVGGGKGFAVRKLSPGKSEIITLDIIGAGKKLGGARVIQPTNLGAIGFSTGAGEGVSARGFSKPTAKFTERIGLRILIPKVESSKVNGKFTSQDIIGTIKPIKGEKFIFVGQTERPITRIDSSGVSKLLKDINIKGIIEVSSNKDVKLIEGTNILKRPEQLTKLETKSVTKQVAAQIASVKDISKPKPVTSTTLKTSTALEFPKQILTTSQSIKQVDKLKSPQKTILEIKERQKSATILRSGFSQDTIQTPAVIETTKTKTDQIVTPGQIPVPKTKQRTTTTLNAKFSLQGIPKIDRGSSGIKARFGGITKIKGSKKPLTVSIRRGGIFKPIFKTTSARKAFEVGTERVRRTLAATFKITGQARLRTPKGFRQKAGGIFIERKELRLGSRGERKEIKKAKKKKKGGKK